MSNPDATGGPSEYSQGFDAGFKEGRKKYPASSNTDDLEALFNRLRHDKTRHIGLGDIRLTVADQDELLGLARSLAQPPSSEVVEVGNLIASALRGQASFDRAEGRERWSERNEKLAAMWDAALAHPKDPAPTVERIMEVVDEWLWSSVPDNQHMRHPLGSKYRTDQPAQDALRARLKTMFP